MHISMESESMHTCWANSLSTPWRWKMDDNHTLSEKAHTLFGFKRIWVVEPSVDDWTS